MWAFLNIVASTARFVSRRPADCLGCEDLGQQLKCIYRRSRPILLSVVRARQSLPPSGADGPIGQTDRLRSSTGDPPEKNGATGCSPRARSRSAMSWIALALCLVISTLDARFARAELFDSLDAYPPRLHLDTSDCDARVIDHKNLSSGGVDGGGCESITFQAGVGSEALLVYPIEPVHAINDLVANLSLMSARSGARVGLRVRFPYFRDPQSRRPVSAIIYGATYDRPGRFQRLGVGNVEREVRIKIANLRAAHGSDTDLSDAYVDAVTVNAYSGPGKTTLRIDQVSVRGMVPVGDHGRVDAVPQEPRVSQQSVSVSGPAPGTRPMLRSDRPSLQQDPVPTQPIAPAFPQDNLIRILEHQGEPLPWVRSLGFDAVLLSSPPTSEILREAIRAQLLVYAPPPVAPDPSIATLLDPVMAWYLGGGVALDQDRVKQTDKTVRRLRRFPSQWQRPIVIAPVESWTSYSRFADAIVSDAALRRRGLPATEQSLTLGRRNERISGNASVAIAIESSSSPKLSTMNDAIESTIGAPPGGCFRWHTMLTQVAQSLEHSPRALIFRSHESLASGSIYAHQRSMALSYTNRLVAMLAPWIASARPASPYQVSGAAYRCGRLVNEVDEFLFLTSDQALGDQVLAGDGQSVEIILPPEMAGRTAWRLTGFSAQRLEIQATSTGSRIELVSPDFAEVVVISQDASLGARLAQSAQRFAARAAADRWQLCGDHLRQIHSEWDHAVSSGATESIMPLDLLTAARRTLADAESVFRAGDSEATLHLARRADAWATRAGFQLSQALLPREGNGEPMRYVSSPPLDDGRAMLQTAWQPLMQDAGWSQNLIVTGGLDQPSVLSPENWTFGQRKLARADSDAAWISRGYFAGRGAIKLSAAAHEGERLGGGYEGTIAILSSPPVPIESGQAIRIDAMIRTIGFGGPHQGILVYDSLGGQEMGVLVRAASEWTPVRLYRQSTGEREVRVVFEVIGDGEAIIDEVSVKAWTPEPLPRLPLRPLSP